MHIIISALSLPLLYQHYHYHCCPSAVTASTVTLLSVSSLLQRCARLRCHNAVHAQRCLTAVGFLLCRRKNVFASYLPEWQICAICSDTLVFTNVINTLVLILHCMNIFVACVADSCKHPCTQSAQRLQFACSNFHENKKPFLIGYFGLV